MSNEITHYIFSQGKLIPGSVKQARFGKLAFTNQNGKVKRIYKNSANLFTRDEVESANYEYEKFGKAILFKAQGFIEDVPRIDKAYKFPSWTKPMLLDIKLDNNVLLTGHSGIGKTTIIEQIAGRLGIPCHRIQLSNGATPESLVGGYAPGSDGVRWYDGLVTKACREGHWVILDEYDACPTSIRTILQGLLEVNNRSLSLNEKDGGEILSRANDKIHHRFRIFATGNSFGTQAEFKEMYSGLEDDNQAQLSRWSVYEVEIPLAEKHFDILRAKSGLPNKVLKQIVDIADEVNKELLGNGMVFSPRVSLAITQKMEAGICFLEALLPSFLNQYRKDYHENVYAIVKKHSNFYAEFEKLKKPREKKSSFFKVKKNG